MVFPFPGFNPYLEHPAIWPGVHHWLIIGLAGYLSPQLRPRYRVAVEVRMYETIGEQSLLVGIPDLAVNRAKSSPGPISDDSSKGGVAITADASSPQRVIVPVAETVKQGYLEVREVATGQVITAIEILSPVNKRAGKGRRQYEEKRNRVLSSQTHLVEIDLLREGKPMMLLGDIPESDYRILVSRSNCRPQADLYAFNVQATIPTFPLPLKGSEQGPMVDLNSLLQTIYDQGSFDLAIEYAQPPEPPFSEEDEDWLDLLLKEQGLR
ncbi:MAG: DUF4058 family protein [Leptolyngbyaceae cyanobacterium MO_188.B28]|nr:DUF4058 family protein [Leptolyngbyaceae cyanobacterium MO_188.B28]